MKEITNTHKITIENMLVLIHNMLVMAGKSLDAEQPNVIDAIIHHPDAAKNYNDIKNVLKTYGKAEDCIDRVIAAEHGPDDSTK